MKLLFIILLATAIYSCDSGPSDADIRADAYADAYADLEAFNRSKSSD